MTDSPDISPAGPAEEAVAQDEVGPGFAVPPGMFGGPPPRQTQTVTVNLPSTEEGRESDIRVIVAIEQDGPNGTVDVSVETHGVVPNPEEYAAISQILSSLV